MKLSDLFYLLLVLNTRRTGSMSPPIVLEKNLGAEYPVFEEELEMGSDGQEQRDLERDPVTTTNRKRNNKGFNDIVNLIFGEILKSKANLAQDLSKPIGIGEYGNPAIPFRINREQQQKKAGENFIRFGRKRRRVNTDLTASLPAIVAPKLIRWCQPSEKDGKGDRNRDPWIITARKEHLQERPARDAFVRFGKGSQLEDDTSETPLADSIDGTKKPTDNTNLYKCKL